MFTGDRVTGARTAIAASSALLTVKIVMSKRSSAFFTAHLTLTAAITELTLRTELVEGLNKSTLPTGHEAFTAIRTIVTRIAEAIGCYVRVTVSAIFFALEIALTVIAYTLVFPAMRTKFMLFSVHITAGASAIIVCVGLA